METPERFTIEFVSFELSAYLFPVRGWKHDGGSTFGDVDRPFRLPFPRKGMETWHLHQLFVGTLVAFRLPFPRKGMETVLFPCIK